MDFNYVVVGAGLSGLTIAERIANDLDEKVTRISQVMRCHHTKILHS